MADGRSKSSYLLSLVPPGHQLICNTKSNDTAQSYQLKMSNTNTNVRGQNTTGAAARWWVRHTLRHRRGWLVMGDEDLQQPTGVLPSPDDAAIARIEAKLMHAQCVQAFDPAGPDGIPPVHHNLASL